MNDLGDGEAAQGSSRLVRWAMAVVWPSFLMAGVLEALVFAVVDPADLSGFGGHRLELSRQAVYTLSFLLFWLVLSVSASLSLLMASLPEPAQNPRSPRNPRNPHTRGWPH